MTPGQEQALEELRAVEIARPGAIRILFVDEAGSDINVWFTVDCRGTEHGPGGIRVRARERFQLRIPPGFPFEHPNVQSKHMRWKGTPHVQWGNSLCLYQSTEAEWNPSDGMYGYLERLLVWLEAAAKGELDPLGAPLHPPVTYTAPGMPMFIPRVNTPPVSGGPWIGVAFLDRCGDRRYDIVDWKELDSLTSDDLTGQSFAVGVLLDKPMPMEYPVFLLPLLHELFQAGVSFPSFVHLLSLFKSFADSEHMHIVVGTPMRGIAGESLRQHLAVWRIDNYRVDAFRVSLPRGEDSAELSEQRGELLELLLKWAGGTLVDWCPVREARPEVTRLRDENSPVQWWKGKTVEIWGCGALGGTIAEHLCRAGVGRLVLRDNSRVAPGVLGRQNFEDGDIGEGKASALAARLKRISPDLDVIHEWTDLTVNPRADMDWSNGADVRIRRHSIPSRLEAARIAPRPPEDISFPGRHDDRSPGPERPGCHRTTGGHRRHGRRC